MPRTLPAPPPRLARLPRDRHGRVTPWFVAWIDGEPDHRIVRTGAAAEAMMLRLCWLCGGSMGAHGAFVLGVMCTVNRIAPEPPSHRDCALYATVACPFLATPRMSVQYSL